MNVNNLLRAAVVGAMVSSFAGCQSWQGAPFPMQNATRVPPPGTGTYQLPSGYYNNPTSALPATNSTQTAAAAPGLRPATGTFPSTGLPATNLASASLGSSATNPNTNGHGFVASGSSANGSVSSASYVDSPASPAPVIAAAHVQSSATDDPSPRFTAPPASAANPTAGGPNAGMPGAESTDVPSLQWQQFGGQ